MRNNIIVWRDRTSGLARIYPGRRTVCMYANGELVCIDMRKEAEDMHETAVIEVVNIMARVAAKRSRSQLRRRCPVAFLRKTSQFMPLLRQLCHSSEKPSARETAATPIEHCKLLFSPRYLVFGPSSIPTNLVVVK
nr:hypothetical protein Itr_chr01CG08060 [Ipomoea trifida]